MGRKIEPRQDKTGHDRARPDKTRLRQDKTGQDKPRQDKTRLGGLSAAGGEGFTRLLGGDCVGTSPPLVELGWWVVCQLCFDCVLGLI